MPGLHRAPACHDWRTNIVVIGSGVAGLSCALALAPTPVTLVTKTAAPQGGSSVLAQGGIAAAVGAADSPQSHAADTVAAGAGLTDDEAALLLAHDGAAVVRRLIEDGVPFDRAADGEVSLGREAAHSAARIVHSGGDATGHNLIRALLAMVEATPSIRIVPSCFVLELSSQRGRVSGVLAIQKDLGLVQIHANGVVIATGGVGSLWQQTTNPVEATGDGLALAARVGATLTDLEFVQFHPTALLPRGPSNGARLPLLTEALRGAGALLLDANGRRFMPDEHPLAELAPRDVVARAIGKRAVDGPVYLDLRPALAALGEGAFPQAVSLCRRAGFEPTAEPVPITPAAHYHMGGIVTDLDGRTGIEGLWACGESACTGVHGANRLASNSLLEGLVFGERVAAAIRSRPMPGRAAAEAPPLRLPGAGLSADEIHSVRAALRGVMARHVGLVRSGAGLAAAAVELSALQQVFADLASQGPTAVPEDFATVTAWGELRNMLLLARMITHAAGLRCESRGAHFRTDFPETRSEWRHRQSLTLADLPPVWAAEERQPLATTGS